jgi:hypothetical protein
MVSSAATTQHESKEQQALPPLLWECDDCLPRDSDDKHRRGRCETQQTEYLDDDLPASTPVRHEVCRAVEGKDERHGQLSTNQSARHSIVSTVREYVSRQMARPET